MALRGGGLMMRPTTALLTESAEWHGRYATWAAIGALVERFESPWFGETGTDENWYGWEPLPVLDFLEGMTIAGDATEGRRFLDVGSGLGTKMFLAHALGWQASGIEHHYRFVVASKRLFPECPVAASGAFGFDRYDEFDLVYSYRLCRDADDQTALNRHIAERMAPGALFFSAGGPYPDWLEHVGSQVWRVN